MTPGQKLPVLDRYEQLIRAQRREDRNSLNSRGVQRGSPLAAPISTVTTKVPKETKRLLRRRTFDGVLPSLFQSSSIPALPAVVMSQSLRLPSEPVLASSTPRLLRVLPSSEVVRLGKLLTSMIRCLGRFLIVLRRVRSIAIIRKFFLLKDATSNRRLLSQKN